MGEIEDPRLVKLRETNQELTLYKNLVKESPKNLWHQTEVAGVFDEDSEYFAVISGEDVAVKGKLKNLLQMEVVYDKLFTLKNKQPLKEIERLLEIKIDLLKQLVR